MYDEEKVKNLVKSLTGPMRGAITLYKALSPRERELFDDLADAKGTEDLKKYLDKAEGMGITSSDILYDDRETERVLVGSSSVSDDEIEYKVYERLISNAGMMDEYLDSFYSDYKKPNLFCIENGLTTKNETIKSIQKRLAANCYSSIPEVEK